MGPAPGRRRADARSHYSRGVAITGLEARGQILDELGVAVERIALAVACLTEAYEHLAVTSADRLEAELFRPAQKAFGRAKRTHSQFAERTGSPAGRFEQPSAGRRSQGVTAFVERAVVAAVEADHLIADLQDTMLPTEFGDPELRSGLSEIRASLDALPAAARGFLRTLGR